MAPQIKNIDHNNSVKELRYKLKIIADRQRYYRKRWLEMDIKKSLINSILKGKYKNGI